MIDANGKKLSPQQLLDRVIEEKASGLELRCLGAVVQATLLFPEKLASPAFSFPADYISAFRDYVETQALRNPFGQIVGVNHRHNKIGKSYVFGLDAPNKVKMQLNLEK